MDPRHTVGTSIIPKVPQVPQDIDEDIGSAVLTDTPATSAPVTVSTDIIERVETVASEDLGFMFAPTGTKAAVTKIGEYCADSLAGLIANYVRRACHSAAHGG